MKKIKRWLVAILAALIIIPSGWMMVVQLEGGEPVVAGTFPETLGESQTFAVALRDEKSGLRSARAWLERDGKEWTLFEEQFPAAGVLGGGKVKEKPVEFPVDMEALGIPDGEAVFQMEVRDYSWRDWWHGNKTQVVKNMVVDSKPPVAEILSRAHNVNQGGAGLVVYRLSEPCPESGVAVGDRFFPGHAGYFDDDNMYLAFFALAYDQDTGTEIHLEATDRAGNKTRAGFYHHLRKRKFAKDVIRLSDSFLDWKMPEFQVDATEKTVPPMLAKFLTVNRKLREENGKFLASLGLTTEPVMRWEGAFVRLPNSARRASFADHREYVYNGEVVDHQTHMGIDLASLEKSPIPAGNAGKVVFADSIGIYGNTVVLDHGFGLLSLYSHLSGIDVESGQVVSKGEIIGRTGITGLAGGDHLHFGMMIHDTMINPIEWWDGNWIMHNVTDKLEDAKQYDHS